MSLIVQFLWSKYTTFFQSIGERKGGAFNHFSVTTSEDEEDLNDMLTNMHKVENCIGDIIYIIGTNHLMEFKTILFAC